MVRRCFRRARKTRSAVDGTPRTVCSVVARAHSDQQTGCGDALEKDLVCKVPAGQALEPQPEH